MCKAMSGLSVCGCEQTLEGGASQTVVQHRELVANIRTAQSCRKQLLVAITFAHNFNDPRQAEGLCV